MTSDSTAVLRSAWGSSPTDVFIVGHPTSSSGVILHYDGDGDNDGNGDDIWEEELTGIDKLNSTWGTAPDNVFAVGKNGTILQYNGADWNTMTSSTTLS